MKPKLSILLIVLFSIAPLALAQNAVDGNWTAEITTQRGAQTITLKLKAEGNKLTGSVAGGRGGEIPIEDGTIEGNNLKFKQKQQGRGGEIVLTYTGTLKGDEIAFKRMAEGGQGQAQDFTAKRQK